MDRAWAEINLSNLAHSARALQNVLDDNTKVMAVVKADAYGQGEVLLRGCRAPMIGRICMDQLMAESSIRHSSFHHCWLQRLIS